MCSIAAGTGQRPSPNGFFQVGLWSRSKVPVLLVRSLQRAGGARRDVWTLHLFANTPILQRFWRKVGIRFMTCAAILKLVGLQHTRGAHSGLRIRVKTLPLLDVYS